MKLTKNNLMELEWFKIISKNDRLTKASKSEKHFMANQTAN